MSYKKEIVTAVGTLAIAVGIGFVMQNSESAQQRYGKDARPVFDAPAPVSSSGLTLSQTGGVLLDVQDIELTSAAEVAPIAAPSITPDVTPQPASLSAPATLPPVDTEEVVPTVDACEIVASAKAIPGAMAQISLEAPCAQNERLTVHHNGMMFTEATDDDGSLVVTVPALAADAVFILAFANGDGAVAQTPIDDMEMHDRVALQWRGQAGFQLHAREFGADYGSDGHVWLGAAPNIPGLQNGENGFLMRMGNDQLAEPLVAEVYTFPSGKAVQTGTIDLSVEAEVTAQNCGLEVEAQSLEIMEEGSLKTRDLTLSVPNCDAVGSFLVLNNLVSDLKVASN